MQIKPAAMRWEGGRWYRLQRLSRPADNAAMEAEPSNAEPPKRKRRLFQFSLRTLLIGVTLASVPMAWVSAKLYRVRCQRAAVAQLKAEGFEILLEGESPNRMGFFPATVPPGPEWLRKFLGDDFFAHVEWVVANSFDSRLRLSDDDARSIASFRELDWLCLSNVAEVTAERIEMFDGMADLEDLCLDRCEISDEAMPHISRHRRLTRLTLNETPITDKGVAYISNLTELTVLELRGTRASDAAVEYLMGLKSLQELDLRGTQVTSDGIKKLLAALPACKVEFGR
jgi:hypothetical protein